MPHHTIIGLGEILWDMFPDGARFGGAPANFACSISELAKHSANAVMVSAIGTDELGDQAIESLQLRGVNTSILQRHKHPTGSVLVDIDNNGVASYRFADDCAWDHLQWTPKLQQLAAECSAACFGTLGQRSETSARTIHQFVNAMNANALKVLDVNLRPPHVEEATILKSLELANVLKLNDEELPLVASLCGASGSETEVLQSIASTYSLKLVALTRGANGAAIVSADEVSDRKGMPVEVVDTVGAGDAFTAALVLGLLRGDGLDAINRRAIEVASFVCSQPGATMAIDI